MGRNYRYWSEKAEGIIQVKYSYPKNVQKSAETKSMYFVTSHL